MTERFDFNEALKAIQSGQAISGKDGVLAPLLKQLTEAALEAELDSHLADDVVSNRKNGKSTRFSSLCCAAISSGTIMLSHR